jgi:uncharacterized protein (TIGR00725 family)
VTAIPPDVYVAVIGPADASPDHCALAHEVGRLLGRAEALVLTGGLGGVMAAASRGAKEAGGRTVGVLPGRDRAAANEWVDVALPTGLAEVRNAIVVGAADAVIAVGGSWGTLSEIALARRAGRPVVGLQTWTIGDERRQPVADGVLPADDPEHAVALALALASEGRAG